MRYALYNLNMKTKDELQEFFPQLLWSFVRRGGLMVSVLIPGASGPGSSCGRGHCVVFLGKTLNSHSASLHPQPQVYFCPWLSEFDD